MNLDAYTVRKIAPRLFFAVVGVNLSIYLCAAAVDITSVVGHGIAYLIRAPFDVGGALHATVDQGAANAAAPLIVVGIVAAVITAKGATGAVISSIWFLLLPAFILVLLTLITLALRQALIILLTLISPAAIVLAVLPGTEKYFKQWWDLFLKTLIAYPIIAAIFAVSDVLTAISFNASNSGGNLTSSFNVINGMLYAFMPLVMIPFAFRMSGGALGGFFNATQALRSAVNRYATRGLQKNFTEGLETVRGEGLFGRTNRRQVGTDEHGAPIYQNTGFRHRMNQVSARLANMNDIRLGNPIQSVNASTQRAIARQAQKINESERGKMLAGFDDELWAAVHSDGTVEGIERALMARAGPRFNYLQEGISTEESAKRRRDLTEARTMIQEFNRAGGGTAGRAAAAVALHGVSTSYDTQFYKADPATGEATSEVWREGDDPALKSEKVYKTSERQMQESILAASGGLRGLGNWITAESIKGAKQAGRYDLAASASAVVMYQEAMRSGNRKAVDDMEKYYEKMMLERVTPAQMLQGHPRAAKEMSIVWKKHLDKLAAAMGPEATKNDSLETMQAKQEEFLRAVGDVAGIQDVLGSAGKEAVDYFDKGLLGKKVTVNLGDKVDASGKPIDRPEEITYEEVLERARLNPIVHQRRHEYRRQAGIEGDDAEAAAHMHHNAEEGAHGLGEHNPMNPLH